MTTDRILRQKYAENMARRRAAGIPPTKVGGRFPRFTLDDAETMRSLRRAGWTYDDIAREFDCARSVVQRYCGQWQSWRWAV